MTGDMLVLGMTNIVGLSGAVPQRGCLLCRTHSLAMGAAYVSSFYQVILFVYLQNIVAGGQCNMVGLYPMDTPHPSMEEMYQGNTF